MAGFAERIEGFACASVDEVAVLTGRAEIVDGGNKAGRVSGIGSSEAPTIEDDVVGYAGDTCSISSIVGGALFGDG